MKVPQRELLDHAAAVLAHTTNAAAIAKGSNVYAHVDDVWHVLTGTLREHLGFELAVSVRSAAPEPPEWLGDALQRLARDVDGMQASEVLIQRGVRIGPPYFKQTQRLVPLTVALYEGSPPLQVVQTFGLFLDEVEVLQKAPEEAAAYVERFGLVTHARDPWRPPSATQGRSGRLVDAMPLLGVAAERVVEALHLRRASDRPVDVVMGLQRPDLVIGVTTVIGTSEGPAWQIAGVGGLGLGLGVRARADDGDAPPHWLRESWSLVLRALDFGRIRPVHEPMQKTETLFSHDGLSARAFIIVEDDTLPDVEDEPFLSVVPLLDAELVHAVTASTNPALVAAVRAATPGLLANLDRGPIQGAASPAGHQLRILTLELDDDDDGPFLVVDHSSACSVGHALRAFTDGVAAALRLVNAGDLVVTFEVLGETLADERARVDITGENVVIRAPRAVLRKGADALASGEDMHTPMRILVLDA
jgi:hypothetical protein